MCIGSSVGSVGHEGKARGPPRQVGRTHGPRGRQGRAMEGPGAAGLVTRTSGLRQGHQ